MRTRGSKLCRKMSLQNCQILENLLGNIEIFPSQNPGFLNGFPTFFNGFLLSSMAFRFLQWLSTFFNGFPLSSMAFCRRGLLISLSVSDQKIPNNLISLIGGGPAQTSRQIVFRSGGRPKFSKPQNSKENGQTVNKERPLF